MRTKVRFKHDDDSSHPRYLRGDYGEIDGYIGDTHNQYAIVIVNNRLAHIPIGALEVLNDNTVIPIPDSNKFPTDDEIHEMAEKYNLGPNYSMAPTFWAAMSWIKDWMKKRNLL